jgi:hypothetical protein
MIRSLKAVIPDLKNAHTHLKAKGSCHK